VGAYRMVADESFQMEDYPMIRRVIINTIPPEKARYRTVGDWKWEAPGVLAIDVCDSGNWLFNMLVAIHEFIEVFLCTAQGVTQKQVDQFDFAHQDDDDPGEHPKAPYHAQHMLAMSVEMLLSVALGIKWRPYSEALTKTWFKTRKRAA
jgi:hypothetical protein